MFLSNPIYQSKKILRSYIRWNGKLCWHHNPNATRLLPIGLSFPHSPSNRCEAKCAHEMLCLRTRKGFSEDVGCHLLGRTINQLDRASLDDVTNEMIMDINVLCAGMVMSIFRECNGRLTVTEQCGWLLVWPENLRNELMKLYCFLCSMCSSDIFSLCGR